MTYGTFPSWLHVVSMTSIALALVCAAIIVIDEVRYPQKMWVMNAVWALTALFGSVLWLAAYCLWGRNVPDRDVVNVDTPFAAAVMKGTSHCGAGCAFADIVVELAAFVFPAIAVWFGWPRFFAEKTFAVWIPDFLVAFLVGILFQYYSIKPMREVSPLKALRAAIKADIASITAWQLGMYGLMAAIQFVWFRRVYGGLASVASPEFWFAMQMAMLAGFAASYPVNWCLIRLGVKERM